MVEITPISAVSGGTGADRNNELGGPVYSFINAFSIGGIPSR